MRALLLVSLAACGRLEFDGLAPPPPPPADTMESGSDAETMTVDAPPPACAKIPECTRTAVFTICGSRCFAACQETRTQPEAEAFCMAWGGHLVSLHDEEERSCLEGLYKFDAWLGYVQMAGASAPDTGWQWIDGSDPSYVNWGSGEPNDGDGVENGSETCGHNYAGRNWNDRPCSSPVGGYACARPAPL